MVDWVLKFFIYVYICVEIYVNTYSKVKLIQTHHCTTGSVLSTEVFHLKSTFNFMLPVVECKNAPRMRWTHNFQHTQEERQHPNLLGHTQACCSGSNT